MPDTRLIECWLPTAALGIEIAALPSRIRG